MAVPLLDVKRQYQALKAEMDEAVLRVLAQGQFILGPEVAQLEKAVAALSGVRFGIGSGQRNRRPAAGPAGLRDRRRGRGDHHALHVHRHR